MIRVHVYFTGTVQGVGFRYTTRGFAADLGLKGWVKNLSDGRVEILVEGARPKVDQFLNQIDQRFEGYIKSKKIDISHARGDFIDFTVAF